MVDRSGAVSEKDLVLSGGFGRSSNSARAGFLPIGLEHLPIGALLGIPVYVRVKTGEESIAANAPPDAAHPHFRLYCAQNIRFAEVHRRRLIEHGLRIVYIRMADQSRFRSQTESSLTDIAMDPAQAIADTSAIIYCTSVELVNELLAEPELLAKSPRLEQISRAITTLVINDPSAFSHLFTASHHDFYTATHMVNVATWMVPLAYALGHRDPDDLNHIAQAGILHDMGKVAIPELVLNKKGKLSDDEWAAIKGHPDAGCEYLSRFEGIHPMVMTVTRQHHERLDGSGYPRGLKGDQIDRVSRICAVVDSFDAMTAFRPFKDRTLSVPEALKILESETPAKYDPEVMDAWLRLLGPAMDALPIAAGAPSAQAELSTKPGRACKINEQRRQPRHSFHCPGRMHALIGSSGAVHERPATPIVAHSISQGGIGLLCQIPVQPGDFVRVYLRAAGWADRALDGQIVRCRSHNDSWHEIGLQFTKVDAETLLVDA